MSIITEQIAKLRCLAEYMIANGEKNDAKQIKSAADTIEALSEKLHNSQMERSSQYYHGDGF